MAKDVNLRILDAATPYTTSAIRGAAVATEGGFYALVTLIVGTITGTGSDDLTIEACTNADGATYKKIGAFPQLKVADTLLGYISRVCYIPKVSAARMALAAANRNTLVRLAGTVVGTSSVTLSQIFVEPLTSLAPPAVDSDLGQGLEKMAVTG
jgi:hypothetical protein